MRKRPTLTDAIVLAAYAHEGKTDKVGEPYLLHCLRVMLHFNDEAERMVAVLHDVIEDTHITLETLEKEGYPKEIREALEAISRRPDEEYDVYIERLTLNPLARKVKVEDLWDNIHRINRLPPEKQEFFRQRYSGAVRKLLD